MLNRLNAHSSFGKKIISLLAISSLLFFFACEDRSDLVAPGAPDTGSADFSRFVSLGNSLTAGYQNGSLYESSQMYSFGKLIADQVGTSYEIPFISNPGIPGKLELHNLTPVILPNSSLGTPTNTGYQAPYNNLGVPGAILYDLMDETDLATKYAQRGNPYFQIVMRDQTLLGASLVKQALALHPTFMTLWIGNNDVLGYATSGGTKGTDPATGTLPTDIPTFTFLYNQLATAITDTSGLRKIAVANIPDVQNIPFFTTIGLKIGKVIAQDTIVVNQDTLVNDDKLLYYQMNDYSINVATPDNLFAGDVLVTLISSPYASLIGTPTGKFYRDYGIDPALVGVDTTAVFGLTPQNPWPNALILDAGEITITKNATAGFNTVISDVVKANSDTWVLVDINKFFSNLKAAEIANGGMLVDGIKFSTRFIKGNTFSLDGVHPTTQGYGVIANEFIKAINDKFGSAIPAINVSTLPASIPLAD